jgi:hypothetical protein
MVQVVFRKVSRIRFRSECQQYLFPEADRRENIVDDLFTSQMNDNV